MQVMKPNTAIRSLDHLHFGGASLQPKSKTASTTKNTDSVYQ